MPVFTASRTFYPGDVIHKEKPYVKIVCREFKDEVCSSCFERAENLKSCKQCLDVKYCGKICQKTDWKYHRLECKKLKNLQAADLGVTEDDIHLLGNVILKIKGQDWKTIKSTILGTDVSFDDIYTHLEAISENNPQILKAKQLKELVRLYIGDEHMPNEDDFMNICEKVLSNVLVDTMKSGCTVFSFSIGIPFIDADCIPNCNITSMAYEPTIWAMKKINKFEKISVCYQNILVSSPFSIDSKSCKCRECSLPYGESLLSKCTDEKQAFTLISITRLFLMTWDAFPILRNTPAMQQIAEELLQKQENVLGSTHILHLRLLAIKCFQIGGHTLEHRRNLMKLEQNMVAVYGEYFVPMKEIYDALASICFHLGDMGGGFKYLRKKKAINAYEELAEKKAGF